MIQKSAVHTKHFQYRILSRIRFAYVDFLLLCTHYWRIILIKTFPYFSDTSAEPLKALLSGDSSVARPRRIAATTGAQASGSSNISAETSSTVAPSSVITSTSSERSSTGDVKAAVENIQAMFAAYLENHRSTNNSSSDDSNS